MNRRRLAAFVVTAALLAPCVASGQEWDLASAAEREKERRKKATGAARTYTNQSLPQSAEASPTPAPEPSPSPSPPGETHGTARGEAHWRGRATSLSSALAAAEQRVKRAQEEYDAARKGNIQPLPIDAVSQVPPIAQVNPEADRLQKELEAAKAGLTQAQKAVADLEEEARKAGVPPGWLR